jgi:hypothetical protein
VSFRIKGWHIRLRMTVDESEEDEGTLDGIEGGNCETSPRGRALDR